MLSLVACLSSIFIAERVVASPPVTLEKKPKINYEFSSIRDRWTQHFFDLIRPELINKKLKSNDLLYRREKAAISQIVSYILSFTCQQPDKNTYYFLIAKISSTDLDRYPRYRYYPRGINRYLHNRERRRYFSHDDERKYFLDTENIAERNLSWQLKKDYFFEGLYQDLTDAVFYARHPELSYEKTQKLQHLNWAGEWNFIRRHFANYNQEEILKQDFIPVCQNNLN